LIQVCIKSFVGWGFGPDPTGGANSALPDTLAGFKEPYFKGTGGEGKRREGIDVKKFKNI